MYERLFDPIRVGTMDLHNRITVPTHAAGVGRILGSDKDAERFIAYYVRRARGGAAWIGGSSTFLRSPLIPGYEPTGVGAVMRGSYRHPLFVERHKRYMEALHEAGACGTVQMIIQGGLPHGASQAASGFVYQDVPHALTRAEIAELVDEYGWSAGRALEAEIDGLEIHANHDDLLQFFLSPFSNQRDDEYGGSVENRMRFLMEALNAIRSSVGQNMTVGVRLCMDELMEGGYDFADGLAMARALSASRLTDYLHVDVGNNWGAPSYLQPMQYEASSWTAMAGELRAAVDVPVVYTGRVTHPAIGERILADGHADVVGMARATIADPDLPNKAREGRLDALRPCVGSNECLHRGLVDGMRFSCAVNPSAGHELATVERASEPRRVLVVGGGPAGLETAAVAAERGHDVTLWEREPAFIEHQARRLQGATVELGREATADDVLAFAADAVVIATGAAARIPDVPGAELAVGVREVLSGVEVGERVVLIAGTDHAEPLLGADFLASRGAKVRVVYPGPQLAPLVGKYSIGGYVARLFAAGVEFVPMQRLVRVEAGAAHTVDVYAGTPMEHAADTVVLACGGEARTALYAALEGRVDELHILGDAWAPRRLTIATRQAWELGRTL
jgi:2,4-dienoyl-CoA reductase-like NADH-dependent reductase (Old Yellow Enzyme family)/thioredoxin reductase